jgi:hypothetical protein
MKHPTRVAVLAAAVLVCALLADGAVRAAEPPLMIELTDDEAKTAAALLSFACKARPGEDLKACDAASHLRRKIASAVRKADPPASPIQSDGKPMPPPMPLADQPAK